MTLFDAYVLVSCIIGTAYMISFAYHVFISLFDRAMSNGE